jgi:diketogulonate reductase-like aldo/keto reductase
MSYENAKKDVETTLAAAGLEYVDLYAAQVVPEGNSADFADILFTHHMAAKKPAVELGER